MNELKKNFPVVFILGGNTFCDAMKAAKDFTVPKRYIRRLELAEAIAKKYRRRVVRTAWKNHPDDMDGKERILDFLVQPEDSYLKLFFRAVPKEDRKAFKALDKILEEIFDGDLEAAYDF